MENIKIGSLVEYREIGSNEWFEAKFLRFWKFCVDVYSDKVPNDTFYSILFEGYEIKINNKPINLKILCHNQRNY